jgi:hypothetical protein
VPARGYRRLALVGIAMAMLILGSAPAAAANVASSGAVAPTPTFTNYYAPAGFTGPKVGQCSGNPTSCDLTGEPSLSVNPATGAVLNQQWLTTGKLTFDDTRTPPAVKWEDVSPPADRLGSLDAILFTDRQTGRTFVSQLNGACSITSFTDNDGGLWLPSQGCGAPNGPDHQTIGGGPPPSGIPTAGYPNVVYYCSQGVAAETCASSLNGGITFNPSTEAINASNCVPGLHGHVKVSPDGTAYEPIKACDMSQLAADTASGLIYPGYKGLAISTDASLTPWGFSYIPDSYSKAGTFGHDPYVAIGKDNTLYYAYNSARGYEDNPNPNATVLPFVAISHDHGKTWSESRFVAPGLGLKNTDFITAVAGDDNRLAVAFLGTTTGGHSDTDETHPTGSSDKTKAFKGVWYLYVSMSYDGGKTWTTVNATPNDPVQRGCIAPGSGSPCRNMLDFNDIAVDKQGRVLVAYTDGCHGGCETDPNWDVTKRSRVASVVRQTCGLGLYAAYDRALSNGCFTAATNAFNPTPPVVGGGGLPQTASAGVGGLLGLAVALGAACVLGTPAVLSRRRRRGGTAAS